MLENNHKIEDIKRRLYEREDTVTHRSKEGVLHPVNHKVEPEWQHEEENITMNNLKKPKSSIFKKFFILSIIFFICAMGYAYYMFSNGGISVSNDNIDIVVVGNAFAKGGEELPLQIEIINRNKASLELSNLQISYPNGASDNIVDYVRLPRIVIGTIKPGETITQNIKITLYGEEKSNRNIKIDLDYHPEGSNAIFTKNKEYSVNISSAPLSLTIEAPDTVTSDQDVTFSVMATLNTTLPKGDTALQLSYPNNFVYESAIPAPTFGNSIWSLESLNLTNPIKIQVKGRIIAQAQDQQVFHVYAGTINPTDKSTVNIVYNSSLHTITVVKPFLEANIIVDNAINSGDKINARISWVNNLSSRIIDAEIIANISGNVFEKASVDSNDGFYDSANSRIIWDKNSITGLGSIEPGAKGEVTFSLKTTSLVGSQVSIKDPQVVFDISIRGKQPTLGSTYTEVNNFSKKIVKLLSDFQIASSVSFKSGSLPPKAETETKYDVTWTLSNSTNVITGAIAKASIPIYVKWVGSVSQKENITYNELTREVVWNIGSVKVNTGSASNREATFTLSLNPSISQVGSIPQLMKDLYLSGQDSFAGVEIKSKRNPINTMISDDPNYKPGQERVIE